MKRLSCSILLGLAVLFSAAAAASAAVSQDALLAPGAGPHIPEGGACNISNVQGALASGFLSWNVPGGGLATLFDPEGSGGAGDPGCGGGSFVDMNFRIDTVTFNLGDEVLFGTGTGVSDFDMSVVIRDFATPGDPCGGPGPVLFDSGTITVSDTGLGFVNLAVPVGIEVGGPFFAEWNLLGTSVASETITPLWDGVARPTCRQWVTQDSGAMYTDFTTFFIAGDTGWVDVQVDGEFVELGGGIADVPVLDEAGIVGLVLLLGLVGAFVVRQRMA